MEKYIYCRFNLFDLHQRVHVALPDGTVDVIAISDLENLGEVIPEMCKKHNIYKVHLFGNDNFTTTIRDQIHTNAVTKYGINNIEIEVEVE